MKTRSCKFWDENLEFLPSYTFNVIDKNLIAENWAPWSLTLILLLITVIVRKNAKKKLKLNKQLVLLSPFLSLEAFQSGDVPCSPPPPPPR